MENAPPTGPGDFAALSAWLNSFGSKDGKGVDLWWRDDDACDATGKLDALIDISDRLQIPVLLSVIPAKLNERLARRLQGSGSHVIVAQHGYDHQNHADDSKSEFPPTRDLAEVMEQVLEGRRILENAFGDRFLPVFVAPFNNWPRQWIETLRQAGYHGLSTIRGVQPAASFEMDVHVDLVTWLPDGAVMRAEDMDLRTRVWLERGRDAGAPIGLMTHHLQMRHAEDFSRLKFYLRGLRQCGALRFVSPRDVFAKQAVAT